MAGHGFSQSLQQSQRQELALLPRMLQSIEVLQLPALELEGYLWQAIQDNEALQLDPSVGEALRPENGRSRAAAREASDRHAAWLESLPDGSEGLLTHLERELALVELSDELRPWVELVLSGLDGRGYLVVDDERLLELARDEGLSGGRAELGRAIALVQSLEPRGVGARDLTEALLLQLRPDEPDYELLCRLIEEFLGDLGRNKLPQVAEALGLELEELAELLARLRELEPVPGGSLDEAPTPAIRPDLVVRRGSAGWEIEIEDSTLPAVRIDDEVVRLARDRAQSTEVRRYLRERVDRARWLVDAVNERKATLRRVALHVFERQSAFLERGPGHLAPLSMTETASDLGLHVSTVSRAVAGKHADTPWGILPLRSFFQSSAGGSADVSREVVLETLRSLVAEEDPERPRSDGDLVDLLGKRGLEVARRTVAKYRNELGIASSYRRRRFA